LNALTIIQVLKFNNILKEIEMPFFFVSIYFKWFYWFWRDLICEIITYFQSLPKKIWNTFLNKIGISPKGNQGEIQKAIIASKVYQPFLKVYIHY